MKRTSTVFLSIFFLSLFLFVAKALAANESVVSESLKYSEAIKQEQANQEQFTDNSLKFHLLGLLNQVAGDINQEGGSTTDAGGAIGGIGRMIAMTYQTKPADTQSYVADLLQEMNLVEPAYAQGIGFSALQPVLNLWKLFRNIAYLFFVFIFLIIGFAIMFRRNLGGQSAVTIQQALPRIIVALLAVSFSYAIAGLMIDLMWVIMYFLITLFTGAGLITEGQLKGYALLNLNIFDLYRQILSADFVNRSALIVGELVDQTIGGEGITDVLGNVAGGLTTILAALIIFVAILFAVFRTFFSLIKIYFEIILTIVFAPLILMLGAINGNAFGNWLKGLVVNLMVFPALLVFILIAFMLINSNTDSLPSQLQSEGFLPPFIPGRSSANTIGLIGGIAAIMLLPEVAGIMAKYKPQSIWDDLGSKAWSNAMKGKGIGLGVGVPLIGAGAGLGAGALVGTYNAARAGGDVNMRERLRMIGSSAVKGGVVGGFTPAAAPIVYRTARRTMGNILQQGGQAIGIESYNRARIWNQMRRAKSGAGQHEGPAIINPNDEPTAQTQAAQDQAPDIENRPLNLD